MHTEQPPAEKPFKLFQGKWTGAVVNVIRAMLGTLGAVCAIYAICVATYILLLPSLLPAGDMRWYIPPSAFVASVVFFLLAKHFSISSVPFLIPDTLRWAHESGKYGAAEIESMVRTLEAHTGRAAFFTRIGFNGIALGTMASALFVLCLAVLADAYNWLEPKESGAILDLAKLLFGAFIGSFASNKTSAPAEPPRAKPADAVPTRQSELPK